MLNKLAVSAPPTYNQEKHDSEDYFTADRRQTLCRHDGKQGLHRYGQWLTHEPCEEQDERKPS